MSDNSNHNNKDPIERLFRKKAEEYDISYREEDWLQLEKQLDQQDRQRDVRKKGWLIAAAVLLLFSLLGYAVYQNYREINKLNEQMGDQNTVETPQKENGENPPPGNDQDPGYSPDQDYADSRSEAQTDDTGNGNTDIVEEKTGPSTDKRENTNSTGNTYKSGPGDDAVSQESRLSRTAIPGMAVDDLPCVTCRLLTPAVEQSKRTTRGLAQALIPSPYPHMAPSREKTRLPGVTDRPGKRRDVAASRAFIGIAGGPDLSTVDLFSDFDQPGYNLGLLLEYRLTSSFSIRTGLMRSSVQYVADGSEYHPPAGFWSYETVPEQTTARCIILDIPVSLKYAFWNFDQSRVYATAGLNSYIMLNEDYRFDYGYENDGDNLSEGWSGRTGTRHWMSNASLSIGYAFDLSPQVSMQIEPFMKLPINDVGWGSVKLYSMGTVFSLNYKLY